MRTRQEILQHIHTLPTGNVHQTQNHTIATRVLIEVLVDIRDILNTFLQDVYQHLFADSSDS